MPLKPKTVTKPKPTTYTKPPRAKTTERGYGHDHQRQRARLLAWNPFCQHCNAAFSEHLHHKDGNPFNRDESNLEAVCLKCHQKHHRDNAT